MFVRTNLEYVILVQAERQLTAPHCASAQFVGVSPLRKNKVTILQSVTLDLCTCCWNLFHKVELYATCLHI